MKLLSIQIHLKKEFNDDIENLILTSQSFKDKTSSIKDMKIEKDIENQCLNIHYKTDNLKVLWKKIKDNLSDSDNSWEIIKNFSIIICEGKHAWDDYLLLHHYKESEKLDDL